MITIIKRILKIQLLVLAFSPMTHAATVSFFPSTSNVLLGDVFAVDIITTDFPTNFDGGSLSVFFDASVLQLDNVSVNSGTFEFLSNPGTIDNSAGSVVGIEFATFNPTPTNFDIATLTFTAVGTVISVLDVEKHASFNFPDFSAGAIAITGLALADGSVTVVPIPAAIWLFGSGLLGLIGVARRRV